MVDEKLLKSEEKAIYRLRSLYKKYGYLPYKMNRFEEYELYIRNKDFLVSDRVITFNDTDGRLLALKPDVTLSIIKTSEDHPGEKRKVFYDETVYRVSERTHRYKEIMQTGLECIGDIDLYDIQEVISLAVESLAQVQDTFMLQVSHVGLIRNTLEALSKDPAFIEEAIGLIEEKNTHDLMRLCSEENISAEKSENLCRLVSTYGNRQKVLKALSELLPDSDLQYLLDLSALLDRSPYSDKIIFDFSIVNNMNYYNGFVFRGYIDGISDGVLAGGQYDSMMQKMGHRSGAIGFALYLDLLESLAVAKKEYDVQVLLLYSEKTPAALVAEKVNELIGSGLSVSAQKAVPSKLKYREMVDLRKEEAGC